MARKPMWIVTREGQDWRDEESLAAIRWLTSTVPASDWADRMAKVRAIFEPARDQWPSGARRVLRTRRSRQWPRQNSAMARLGSSDDRPAHSLQEPQ